MKSRKAKVMMALNTPTSLYERVGGGRGGGDRTNLISWQSWIANVEGMVGDAPEEWEEAGKNSESLTGLAATLGKWEVKAEPIIWLR